VSMGRDNNIPIIFTQEVHRNDEVDFGLELEYGEPIHCLEGSKGVDFIDTLRPGSDDYIIRKRRYSAFFATDLEILLKGLKVDVLILAGVATDVCVRATAQDAHQLNYKVVVVPECVAGTNPDRHLAALENISYIFGSVVPLDSLGNRLCRQRSPLTPGTARFPASIKSQIFNS
ncbi:MAG: isochorismatase family cysteine hydrolase, partial [Sneathiella sp.]